MLADRGRYQEAVRAEAAGVFNLRSVLKRLRRPAVGIPAALADLISQVSLDIDIVTEPPGADVYVKEYGEPDAE